MTSLQDTRALLAALKPTIDALPTLVRETTALVGDLRGLVREATPVVIESANRE